MRFSIIIRGIKKEVDVEPIDEGKLRVRVDGVDYEVSVEGLKGLANLTGRAIEPSFSYELEREIPVVESRPRESQTLEAPAESAVRQEIKEVVPAIKEEALMPKEAPVKESLVKEVTKPKEALLVKSPLPGVISLVEVKEGGAVKRGDVLLYIESMKMLNEIVAPRDGVVKRIMKSAGEQINVGDPLVEIMPAGE
ncbi:MAG: biotin/lipoyl-binding protein [Candidatus Methanomethyliales bacterium]|nr:biotin/lipoyl-binding protein [Candidatus Methanomethylicales archaeon]